MVIRIFLPRLVMTWTDYLCEQSDVRHCNRTYSTWQTVDSASRSQYDHLAVKPAPRRFLPLISSSARVSLSRHTVRLHFSSRGSIVVVAEFLTSNVLKSSRTDGTLAENWPGARLLGR